MTDVKLTRGRLEILEFFMDRPGQEFHSYAVYQGTNLSTGAVYPALDEFADAGILDVRDAPADESHGRPRRLYYKLNPAARPAIEAARAIAVEQWARPNRRQGQRLPTIRTVGPSHA